MWCQLDQIFFEHSERGAQLCSSRSLVCSVIRKLFTFPPANQPPDAVMEPIDRICDHGENGESKKQHDDDQGFPGVHSGVGMPTAPGIVFKGDDREEGDHDER